MNVVYTFDNGYAEITAVSIVSLLENNKHVERLDLYIIDCGISDENKMKISSLINSFERTVVFVPSIDISSKVTIKLETLYWSEVCYIRLFFAELLPDLDRVMHIDCDTIVRKDISSIYNVDLSNYVCAACYDCSPCPKRSIGIPSERPYYSNGFLIFNLDNARNKDIERRFVEYIEEKKGVLPHLDQDVINEVLGNEVYLLPAEYNVMSNTIAFGERCIELFDDNEPYYSAKEVKNAVHNPIIVHLVGYKFFSRPWAQPCYHPYNKEWLNYHLKTPWCNEQKLLKPTQKKYGFLRETICWIWNFGYRNKQIRNLLFLIEKRSVVKKKKAYEQAFRLGAL